MPTETPSTSLTATTIEMRTGLRGQVGEKILSTYDRDAEAMATSDLFANEREKI